ncbi:hypothetical protein [Azospirillum palustre]
MHARTLRFSNASEPTIRCGTDRCACLWNRFGAGGCGVVQAPAARLQPGENPSHGFCRASI